MGFLSKNVERIIMSEVVAPTFNSTEKAHGLIKEIAGHAWNGRGDMIDRVYAAIRNIYPRPSWTRRRVRALWHREAARVDWREMQELEVVAEIERAKRLKREEARAAHNEFLAHISTTLDRLEVTDAEFHRQHREALCALAVRQAHSQVGATKGESDKASALFSSHFKEIDG